MSPLECEKYYYEYLSILLDPSGGNADARRDSALVLEWCELSVGLNPLDRSKPRNAIPNDGMNNFYRVASQKSAERTVYGRDLVALMDLAMAIDPDNEQARIGMERSRARSDVLLAMQDGRQAQAQGNLPAAMERTQRNT